VQTLGANITFRNNTFYGCPTSNIQAKPFSGATQANWLVENNVFGSTACCNSIVLSQASTGGDCSTFVVRYNILTSPVNEVECTGGRLQSYANIFVSNVSACPKSTTEAYNVYVGGNPRRAPGRTANQPVVRLRTASPPNFHLLSGTLPRGGDRPAIRDGHRWSVSSAGRDRRRPDELPGGGVGGAIAPPQPRARA
jgi:hypothetical protein